MPCKVRFTAFRSIISGYPVLLGDAHRQGALPSCDLPLPEGTGTANYIVTSTSGRTASGVSTWRRDGTPPDLEVNLPPVDGSNGWYVFSEVDLSASATDTISGLFNLNGSIDDGATWVSFPIHFTDGDHQAVTGELYGEQLSPVVSINHFWFSWAAFRPKTRIYQP